MHLLYLAESPDHPLVNGILGVVARSPSVDGRPRRLGPYRTPRVAHAPRRKTQTPDCALWFELDRSEANAYGTARLALSARLGQMENLAK